MSLCLLVCTCVSFGVHMCVFWCAHVYHDIVLVNVCYVCYVYLCWCEPTEDSCMCELTEDQCMCVYAMRVDVGVSTQRTSVCVCMLCVLMWV